jgi:hypothetical protein
VSEHSEPPTIEARLATIEDRLNALPNLAPIDLGPVQDRLAAIERNIGDLGAMHDRLAAVETELARPVPIATAPDSHAALGAIAGILARAFPDEVGELHALLRTDG